MFILPGYGYTIDETLEIANDYACHLGVRDREHPLTKNWYYNFMKRNPTLELGN